MLSSLTTLYFILGLLTPADCGPGQEWLWIPEVGIHACTVPYPAVVER